MTGYSCIKSWAMAGRRFYWTIADRSYTSVHKHPWTVAPHGLLIKGFSNC